MPEKVFLFGKERVATELFWSYQLISRQLAGQQYVAQYQLELLQLATIELIYHWKKNGFSARFPLFGKT